MKYSEATGAEAIIVTGSFFGDMTKRAREGMNIPVMTSFDGIVERAFTLDRPLHVLSTAPDSSTLLAAEIEAEAARRSHPLSISLSAVEGALDALVGGDPERHDELVLEAVRAIDDGTAILFAQFSMERILPGSAAAHPAPGRRTGQRGRPQAARAVDGAIVRPAQPVRLRELLTRR